MCGQFLAAELLFCYFFSFKAEIGSSAEDIIRMAAIMRITLSLDSR